MRARSTIYLALTAAALASGGALYLKNGIPMQNRTVATAAAEERIILYYRDPSGAPSWSAEPKRDAQGRDYKPVYDDEELSFDPPKPPPAPAGRKILYYRNPMGLADVSPVPKKDQMGMDYIPVYDGDAADAGSSVKIDLDRIQRSGVRTEKAQLLSLIQPVRGVGAVAIDERRLTVVTTRSDGYVEDLFVNTTGQTVKAGEPLFRFYSPDIQFAQADLIASSRAGGLPNAADGLMRRLRNLGVPEARIREVRESGTNMRTLDWPSPASGTVIGKAIINGQRISAGTELYRIADLSRMWVIADVAEGDLADIMPGTRAIVTFRSYRGAPVDGVVTFIYPELRAETRTGRVRIEVANADGRLKTDMYADVVFHVGGDAAVVTVPKGAVIDSGARQVVLVAKGEGRFEPRAVKLGRRSDDRVEIVEGLLQDEEVVSGATFLIDAESNLQTALKAFGQPETAK